MWMIGRPLAALLIASSACAGGGAPVQPGIGGEKTGLEGTARLGPTQPVCREGESCDTPLRARFTLHQQGRVVVRFASDSAGHFLVYAPTGTYVVVPDQPIGIGTQMPEVTVGSEGLTHVDLTFDTGIR